MTYWDGDRWVAEASTERARRRQRIPRSLVAFVVAGIVVALVLAKQAATPVSTDRTAGTVPSSGQHGDMLQTGPRYVVSRATGGSVTTSSTASAQNTSAPASSSAASAQKTSAPASSSAASAQKTSAPASSSAAKIAASQTLAVVPATGTTVYIHYYLWWTKQHWQDKLGAAYPYSAAPLPLPGQTDPSGCSPTVTYPGATIVDIPSQGLYDQSLAATFDQHIATAVAYGITGFVADWAGTGAAAQSPSSSGYNARLDLLVQRVDAWNATHAHKFRLAIDFAAFGDYARPASAIINDLRYFVGRYGGDAAFANSFSPRPLVMLIASRMYSLATIQAVSAAARPSLFLLGDETSSSLARDAAYLDGSSYYWSSESPTNSGAKTQVASLGSQLHAAGKPWFAPFTAGYDSVLIGGHCVPRNGLATLDTIWSWNSASHPDAWFGISWNEYVENTYLEPSLKYGPAYLAEIKRLGGL